MPDLSEPLKLDSKTVPFDDPGLTLLALPVTGLTAPHAATASNRVGKRSSFFIKHTSVARRIACDRKKKFNFSVVAAAAKFQVERKSRLHQRSVLSKRRRQVGCVSTLQVRLASVKHPPMKGQINLEKDFIRPTFFSHSFFPIERRTLYPTTNGAPDCQ
jgi:hypothetical protein